MVGNRRKAGRDERDALLVRLLDALEHHLEDEGPIGRLGVWFGRRHGGEGLHAVAEAVEEHPEGGVFARSDDVPAWASGKGEGESG